MIALWYYDLRRDYLRYIPTFCPRYIYSALPVVATYFGYLRLHSAITLILVLYDLRFVVRCSLIPHSYSVVVHLLHCSLFTFVIRCDDVGICCYLMQ